jgi:recombination protein RecR
MAYPEPIERLVREFEKLPGIGERTAERLAFWIVSHPAEEALRLAGALREVKEKIRLCSVCCTVSLEDPCGICASANRDRGTICVVEETRDLARIEATASFRGVYHVLHGRLAPLDGVGPNDLTIGRLLARARAGVQEIILATNPTVEGDATAQYIATRLSEIPGVPHRVTRLARGIPAGSTMEYASRTTISDALLGRRDISSQKR